MRELRLTPKIASIIVPVIIGLIASFSLLFLSLFPINNKVKNISQQLNEYKNKSSELDLILNKFKKTKILLKESYQDKLNLIDIIAGDTDLKTLLAKINSLALETSISIENVKPIKIINFANQNQDNLPNESDQFSSNNDDPLITKATFKEITSLKLSGSYSNLILFLERIERMENIVLINVLKLKSSTRMLSTKNNNILKISFDIVSYGKKD